MRIRGDKQRLSLYLERVVGCLVAVRGRVAVLAVVPGLQGGTGGFSPTPCRGTALQYQQVAELTETGGRVPEARASPPWPGLPHNRWTLQEDSSLGC